ncbi:conserved hypothetical protein [Thermosulfidibacter takaii ABI70S6]|uniref:N(4)-bis(aminopropyl)spermidine synthase C-terminal domain-containing protein n=1 Tax=Thermosulfidibacter takaii (strain DSM 17441 / JCM 13301 / NBRC 103674 / ABI70S6) TaxID=1298851 RepID=A0A0S3QR69_THET7|nr:bis-aminopropyl spermidine synthase family protein [Thermosulfidibacter takaii]BAT70831.1 conserved hypothetical protein [Thermosulfidibacter takaii ABI70S6]
MSQRIRNQILRALKKEPQTFWQLINKQDAHIVEFLENIKSLLNEGLISYQNHRFYLAKDVDIQPEKETKCSTCEVGVEIKEYFREIYEEFLKATKNRPLPTSKYDQGFIRPIDTIKRLAFMYARGDIEGMDIFILGDDDLLSVAIGLTGMARSVTVVEIDERINNFIMDFCEKRGINNIKVKRYNVIEELPEEAKRKFDVFVTDPVETYTGLFLFIARCMEALKGKGSAGYMGFTHLEASLYKWWKFQKFVNDANMVITDIIRDFTYYPENENQWLHFYESYEVMKHFDLPIPEVDWYRSSFVRFEAIEDIKVPEVQKPKDLNELYFDEESWATPEPKEDR